MEETEHRGLTPEEETHYANFAWIEMCDECGLYYGIHRHNDTGKFIEFVDGKFYCNKCKEILRCGQQEKCM